MNAEQIKQSEQDFQEILFDSRFETESMQDRTLLLAVEQRGLLGDILVHRTIVCRSCWKIKFNEDAQPCDGCEELICYECHYQNFCECCRDVFISSQET